MHHSPDYWRNSTGCAKDDAANEMNSARRENPGALQQVVEDWFVKAMEDPVVVGAVTLATAKLLKNQRNY